MSAFYNRMKGALERNLSTSNSYYNPETYNEDERNNARNQLENEFHDDEDDVQSVKNDTPAQPRPLREQARRRRSESPPPSPVNPPNSEIRTVPVTTRPDLPPVTNTDLPVNNNTAPPPPMRQLPQPSTNAALSALRNRRRRPFNINPNSQLVGFPRRQNVQPNWLASSAFMPRQQPRPLPPYPRANISNRQIDYPRENLFLSRRISPSTAMKMNKAVEHDRFNNAYFTHHYPSKPRTQRLECRLVDDTPQTNMRYIHEISYPQTQNLHSIQLIIDDTSPQLTCFPAPVYHFTAHALPNDPMRYY